MYISNGEVLSIINDKIVDKYKESEKKRMFPCDYSVREIVSKVKYMLKHVEFSSISDFKEALLLAEREGHGTTRGRGARNMT